MIETSLRFSPAILRRLGEELNPSIDQGVLELIKNAYDADATTCKVTLSGENGGWIEVDDNGQGMRSSDIVNHWLVLGTSQKEGAELTKVFQRVPTGSKGLGRLACLRMGKAFDLATRAEQPLIVSTLSVDWNVFDNAQTVEEVVLVVKSTPAPSSSDTGTRIRVKHLRRPIQRSEVERLARALILLADPFADTPSAFKPTLQAPEFDDLSKLVEKRYFEHAEYRIRASVRNGRVSSSIVDWRGATIVEGTHDKVAQRATDGIAVKKAKPARRSKASEAASEPPVLYACPDFDFDLWAFILSAEAFVSRTVTLTEVRAWLREFGGVHVYMNGLRVPPYGSAGNDWLEMNLRRVKSPEERPGTNTSIGRVRISGNDSTLPQKTDRSGFIETDAFLDLRRALQDVLDWAGKWRLAQAEKRRGAERQTAPKQSRRSKEKLSSALRALSAKNRALVEHAVEEYSRARDREVAGLRKEVELYRTLSTAGITAATFAHESTGDPSKAIDISLKAIETIGKKHLTERDFQKLSKPVGLVRKRIAAMAVLGAATLKLLSSSKRRVGRVDLHPVLLSALEVLQPFCSGREVTVDVVFSDGNPYLNGTEAGVESILTNLLNNSLAAFEGAGVSSRRIEVRTLVAERTFTLEVSDNGRGIIGIDMDDIWLPGHTTRSGGTGLGLTIVRDSARDLGGTVTAESQGLLGGATLRVELPILGA